MKERLVIIGAGMAAGRLLEHLSDIAPDAYDITLFNAEPRGTYNRIMLSPVLAGEKAYQDIVTHDDDWYAARGITCRFGEKVLSIETDTKRLHAEGGALDYDKLVFATGSQPFIIPVPGHDLPGVVAYRDLDDTQAMIDAARPGARAVVIGGGLLGLEAAAGLRLRGAEVTVVHLAGHLMERQLDPAAGASLKADLEVKGIDVALDASTKAILADDKGQVRAVALADGRELDCDLVVMAVGIRPATALAKEAGVACGRAIEVDAGLRTSTPDVFALGECVEFEGTLFGLVAPLFEQAQVLANTLCGIEDRFAVKELSTRLKVTGCELFSAGDFSDAEGREEIVFRDPGANQYKRLILADGKLIGAVMYGDTTGAAWFFDLIQSGADVTPLRELLIFGPEACESLSLDAAAADTAAGTASDAVRLQPDNAAKTPAPAPTLSQDTAQRGAA